MNSIFEKERKDYELILLYLGPTAEHSDSPCAVGIYRSYYDLLNDPDPAKLRLGEIAVCIIYEQFQQSKGSRRVFKDSTDIPKGISTRKVERIKVCDELLQLFIL